MELDNSNTFETRIKVFKTSIENISLQIDKKQLVIIVKRNFFINIFVF